MHLNILPEDDNTNLDEEFKWGLLGCVGAELVVFAARRQYNSSKSLHAEMQRYLDIQQPVLS